MELDTTYQIISFVMLMVGIILAPLALWRSRTPQGAFAWVVALVAFPFVAVPAFAIFGRKRFHGYVIRRQNLDKLALKELREMEKDIKPSDPPRELTELALVVNHAGLIGFTGGNKLKLLIDGEETFKAMLEGIKAAKSYILFQSYIIRNDEIGNIFRDALVAKAKSGVRVYCLYDKIGTPGDRKFFRSFAEGGVEITGFEGTKNFLKNFQINFRNHRKLLVIDGQVAFLGGLNVGDDYLGRWKKMGAWRDTHIRIEGPAAAASQLSFVKDWYWAQKKVPDLNWVAQEMKEGCPALVIHTGPADADETCNLSHIALVNACKERLWITSPYFVPTDGFANALSLAALRGVDVRIILPGITDHKISKLASEVHVAKLQQSGVSFFRYQEGFLHQKVMLCDRIAGMVGSANLDARSFFINFELMAMSNDGEFLDSMEVMFEKDFKRSVSIKKGYFNELPFFHRLGALASTLAGPML